MELIIFSRIREDLQSWQTRWAFLMACWSQGVCGYLIAYTAVMFFHTLWLDYRICCHKTLRHQDSNVLLFPFSSLCMFYSVALFIFLKYFLFVCISWQRPPCVFLTVIYFWSLCQLYYPRLATSVLQGLQFFMVLTGNQK